ncbi:tyrosine-type recombinase/integrase [Candidatus Palauibacter sp.]|uniref:tyrosine-type recombinase/integrase n=1 Tax=Candidatus Palauibacter sp. TaxID=3101350 RepID=UPI003CC6B7B6
MSPRRRPNGYYQFRKKLPGIGVRARTLGTKNRAIATRRAAALDTLVERGRMDLVRAWLDGRLDLVQLVEAYESGRIDRLTRELNRTNIPTLGEACDVLLKLKAPNVRASSLRRYRSGMVPLKVFFGPDRSVGEVLTTDAIGEYKLDRLERVKAGTVNGDLTILSMLAHLARDHGWIAERPGIVPIPVSPKTIMISSAEQAAYLAALRRPFRPIMAFLLATGCRRSEAERLTVDDITRLADGSWWARIGESKTPAGVRHVPIPRETARQLRARIDELELDGSDPVFKAIPASTILDEHHRAVRLVGIRRDYTVHRHRDTYAVTMARRGMPLPALQRILGHTNIQQTMKYAGFQPDYTDVGRFVDPETSERGTIVGTHPPERKT